MIPGTVLVPGISNGFPVLVLVVAIKNSNATVVRTPAVGLMSQFGSADAWEGQWSDKWRDDHANFGGDSIALFGNTVALFSYDVPVPY